MELFHSGSFWMEFLSKAARCNTRLDGLHFDWQRDSICWVGLQGRDALPAGLMHGSSQRDSHLLNPHLWIIDTTPHLKLSLYFPGRASQIFQCEQSRVHKQGRKMWCWRVCNWKHAKSANSCIFSHVDCKDWIMDCRFRHVRLHLGSILLKTRCNLPKTVIQFLVFPSVLSS